MKSGSVKSSAASFYASTRDLHLYAGLFLAPFILVFAVTAVLFNHPRLMNHGTPVVEKLAIPYVFIPEEALRLTGMAQLEALRPALRRAGISGELGPVIYKRDHRQLVIMAMKPGESSTLEVDLRDGNAMLERTRSGLREALLYLHKYPGQHLAAIRGNSLHMRVWRILADATVYLLLFIMVSGIYLWTVLKSERRIGIVLLAAGLICFGLALYGIVA